MTDELQALITKSADALKRAKTPEKASNILADLQSKLVVDDGEEIPDISKQVDAAIDELESDIQHKGKKNRLPTGLIDLDRFLTISNDDLVVISGESSTGKTALAMNIVEHTSIFHRKPTLIFSIEMPSQQLIFRMMASVSKVDVREATLEGDQNQFKKLLEAATKIRNAPIYIEDSPDLTANQMRAKARRMVAEKGIQLIVVDYLQIVTAEGRKESSEAQELSERAMNFKRMARELKLPIILLSQEEEQSGKLYGSRAPRHHTDTLLQIRQGYIHINKQRNGPRDRSVPVTFIDKWTRFENASKEDELL